MSRRSTYTCIGSLVVAAALLLAFFSTREQTALHEETSSTVAGKRAERPVVSDSSSASMDSSSSRPSSSSQVNRATRPDEDSPRIRPQRPPLDEPRVSALQPIHSGPMRADAAVGGRPAHAVARVGKTEVKLRPDQEGSFQQLQSLPNQAIDFTVSYPWLKKGSEVSIGVADGGTLTGPAIRKADDQGNLSFTFQTNSYPGSYRIYLITPDGDSKTIDVWVETQESS